MWQKLIEEVTPDDWVLSYDKQGKLKPGRVTRTHVNRSKHILDLHGLMMTPGHVTYCAKVDGEDNPFADSHVPVIDILRSDGALKKADGTLIRAATAGTWLRRERPSAAQHPAFHAQLAQPTDNDPQAKTGNAGQTAQRCQAGKTNCEHRDRALAGNPDTARVSASKRTSSVNSCCRNAGRSLHPDRGQNAAQLSGKAVHRLFHLSHTIHPC